MTDSTTGNTSGAANDKAIAPPAADNANVATEATIIAYQTLKTVALSLVNVIKSAVAENPVIIYNEKHTIALTAYKTATLQLHRLATAYAEILKPVATTQAITGAGIGAAVKTAIDLVALFRVEQSLTPVAVPANDLALASEVSGHLAKNGRHVYLPQLFPVPYETSGIAKLMEEVERAAASASEKVANMPEGNARSQARARLKQLDSLRETNNNSALLIEGEAIAQLLAAEPNALVLYLKVLHIGGTNMTWRFLGHVRLKHSGGAVVNYAVFKQDGTIATSGTLTGYSGVRKLGAHPSVSVPPS